jgi:uncharacterized protein (TIGR02996 family)
MILDVALAAARTGAWSACLDAVLAAWRVDRVPALADLVERVASRVTVEPIIGAGSRSAQVRRRIDGATAADVGAILEIAVAHAASDREAPSWVFALARRQPPDPRIARVLAMLLSSAVVERGPDEFLVGGLLVLNAIDDPRSHALVIELSRALAPLRATLVHWTRAIDELGAAAARIATLTPPRDPPELATAIAELDRLVAAARPTPRIAARALDELLDAVYRDPASDELRAVYADALTEAGDPRGELIALQLARRSARGPSAREVALLRSYARTWLGAIDPLVHHDHLVYRRGFAAVAQVRGNASSPAAREWSTLEELYVPRHGFAAVLVEPPFGNLRRVCGLSSADVERIARIAKAPLSWATLGLGEQWHREAAVQLRALGFPALVELDLRRVAAYQAHALIEGLGRDPLGAPLRRIVVTADGLFDNARAWRATAVPELVIVERRDFQPTPVGESVRIERGGRLVVAHHTGPARLQHAVRVVATLSRGTFHEAVFEVSSKVELPQAVRQPLAAALAKHDVAPPQR